MAFCSKPVSSSPGTHWDYLDSGVDGSTPPKFIGKGFNRLLAQNPGISFSDKDSARDLFLTLGLGLSPDGKSLIQTQDGKHTTGIDCIWSAPKWVSALMAVVTPEERSKIQQAWDDHVTVMFNRLEEKATLCRTPVAKPSECERSTRQQGSKTERVTGELIGFVARHHTARPTPETEEAGRPPDPHLHTHVFVFNMAWSHGKWRAIDDYGLKNPHRSLAGQIALESEGELTRRLEDLGYPPEYFEDRRGRFHSKHSELSELVSFWSSNKRRESDVRKEFERRYNRPPNKEELRRAMTWTRTSKKKGESVIDWERVVAGAVDAGIEIPGVNTQHPLPRMPLSVRKRELLNRLFSANGLCGESDDACFGIKDLDMAVARCSVGLGLTLEEQDQFRQELIPQLVEIDQDSKSPKRWTTPKNLDEEWSIYRRLQEVSQIAHPSPPTEIIEQAISDLAMEEGVELDAEQQSIVRSACAAPLLFVEGVAGSGKTTMAKALVRAFRRQTPNGPTADTIIAISTARDTALRTGQKLDAEHMDSVESFCMAVRYNKIKPTDQTVIFLDEAVMVDTHRMAQLLRHSGRARLICIGDRKQLQAIGAGGWYSDAIKEYGIRTLTKVWRQTDPEDIKSLFDLRSGRSASMLSYLQSRDRLHVADTPEECLGQIINDVIADRDSGRSVNDVKVVTDASNELIDTGNRLVQLDRLRRGEIEGEGYTLYSERTGREWTLYAGDEISFCTSYFDGAEYLPNGTRAKVVSIDHARDEIKILRTGESEPRTLEVTHKSFEQPICPDYMIHACRLQGGEAPIIRVMPGYGTTSLESGYSQSSRCIEEVHVYVDRETFANDQNLDPIDVLSKRWKQPKPKISARTRLMWKHKHKEQKLESHLDHGPITPIYEPVAQKKPWLDRHKAKRKWEVDDEGIVRSLA